MGGLPKHLLKLPLKLGRDWTAAIYKKTVGCNNSHMLTFQSQQLMLIYYYLRRMRRLCLRICWFVCLFVYLLATLRRKNGFSWSFQGGWDLVQGIIWNIFRLFHSTPWTLVSFSTFSGESVTVNNITGNNEWTDFHDIFSRGSHETRNNQNIFLDFAVNPLKPRSIFPFSGSVIVSSIMEKRVNGF